MKKTLLIAAAALAAGIITSQAQPVYSQNIVGYVNVPAAAGYTAMDNPLSNNGNNSATNLFDTTSGANDGSIILTWAGTKYSQTMFDSTKATGFADAGSGLAAPVPVLAPGTGFLFNNQNASNTITFTGSVAVDGPGTATNVVGKTTNILSAATLYVFPSSKIAVGGGISSVLGIVNVAGVLDGSIVLVPNIIGGAIHGYTQIMFDSTKATGFANAASGAMVAEPVISVGGSFLFSNQTGSDYMWIQSL
jgi:hypothetical protein